MRPMPGATNGSPAALEAVRGALLASHAASGLAAAHAPAGARLLRAADGLPRIAVAVLGAPKAVPPPAPGAAKATGRPRWRRRSRGRGGACGTHGGPVQGTGDATAVEVVDMAAATDAAMAVAAPAPSVLAVDDRVAEGAGAVAALSCLEDDAWADELPALHGGRMAADAVDAGGLVPSARLRAEFAAATAAHDTRRIAAIIKEAVGSACGGGRGGRQGPGPFCG
ncbi:unnamed protein product [Prorocentrum cordatum]|uniref:Uncharacterized protein n=1 Tax=Prorocentrum cordatum TaxID=2364126 RepID=A0ABN9W963_9DINO|nr:unnamed protein product [Polarella glacialis]